MLRLVVGHRAGRLRLEHTEFAATLFADAVAEMRELLIAIRSTVDRADILALAGQIEELLAREAVVIPTHARLRVGAVWADEITGFNMNSTEAGHTWNIEFWRRLDQ